MCMQNLVKFCPFVFKRLSGNEILTSIKGSNSAKNLPKKAHYNPNVNLVNIYVHTKFGKIRSIHSQDIERNSAVALIQIYEK